jgi:death on curing protein
MIRYLNVADTMAIHNDVMRRFNRPPAPLRDPGGLESAVARPRMAAYYEDADLVRQAALLVVGISQAQAFLDGNKRTAFQALDSFLFLNQHIYFGDPLELSRWLERIADRSFELADATAEFEEWLRGQVEEIAGSESK